MNKEVILIFDIGKTNKKVLLFDRNLKLVHEEEERFKEVEDEDGFPAMMRFIWSTGSKAPLHSTCQVRSTL